MSLKDFFNSTNYKISKWEHYFDIYERHFNRFVGKNVKVLEFGVAGGGSLRMWKDYFGDKSKIYGIDINPNCIKYSDKSKNIEVFIGDQENVSFLRKIAKDIGEVDILIDDGGHTMAQQINTFNELYGIISDNGVYLAEDLHTSYWQSYGGGKEDSFIEFSKKWVDSINVWHTNGIHKVNDFTRSTYSLTYYDSIVVLEKRKMFQPKACKNYD